MRKIIVSLWLSGIMAIAAFAQQSSEITNWKMQDSATVGAVTGETISSSSFTPTDWYTATVPGTVLGTLVDQKAQPDPYFGKNLSTMPDFAKDQHRYWFRASFNATFEANQRVWLEFGGINYFATIFLNGHKVDTMLGAFKEGKFDVTSFAVSGANYLAVKIRGNYTPGSYHDKTSGNCQQNGGPMTKDGPTFIASQGWDWIPTIPDRDMGIWKPVYVRVIGPVAIRHPWIRTTNVSPASAKVPLQVELLNASGAAVSGTLGVKIDGSSDQFTDQTVTIDANSSKTVTFPDLTMHNPKLWWPNGYGDPNLYNCAISFTPAGSTESDRTTFRFGVREFSFVRGQSCGLIVKCNGQRILCRGGNWGMDDAMKRWDLHKLENRVRFHKEMNFNMLRDWIGMTDNDPFYDFCDQYGIMIWSDFWQPHSSDGGDPADLNLFKSNMLDKILRARNHASIAIWCERNETSPTTALLNALQEYHTTYDGTRTVQPYSGSVDAHSGGPYEWISIPTMGNKVTGFHTEIGSQTVPSYETMKIFLPEADQWPTSILTDNIWGFHDFCKLNANPSVYVTAMNDRYGAASSLQEFCTWAQLMNYDEYRAYFETLQGKRFASSNGASGILLWMSNSVWPSTMWQTYDYYMEGTGAMYGCQKGSEPIHIMYHGSTNIQVVNNTAQPISNYTVVAKTYNLDGTSAWNNSQAISVAADTLASAFAVTAGTSTPYFLDLKLKDATGSIVSKNFYVLPNDGSSNKNMLTMSSATVNQTQDAKWEKGSKESTLSFKLFNAGTVCAVSCRLFLARATSGARILPCHYSDNYFSLAPGDTQSFVIKFDEVDRNGENPKLRLTGINVAEKFINIDLNPQACRFTDTGKKTEMHIRAAGNIIKICNAVTGKMWQLTLCNMAGRIVLDAKGMAKNSVSMISIAGVRPGAYIVTVKSAGELYRTLVTIAKH